MLDHISIAVKEYTKALEFYDATLATLNYKRIMSFDLPYYRGAGYGIDNQPQFWLTDADTIQGDDSSIKGKGFHVAFKAASVEQVNAWYEKCIEMGGTCNGKPGPRALYHPGYYGAFIIDPNGHHIEAVIHHYNAADA